MHCRENCRPTAAVCHLRSKSRCRFRVRLRRHSSEIIGANGTLAAHVERNAERRGSSAEARAHTGSQVLHEDPLTSSLGTAMSYFAVQKQSSASQGEG